MQPMTTSRRLIPILAAVLVIQGLVGVLPHTHGHRGAGSEISGVDGSIVSALGVSGPPHDCLACSIHAPVFESAANQRFVHAVEQASPTSVVQWSITILALNQTANPRAPPRIV